MNGCYRLPLMSKAAKVVAALAVADLTERQAAAEHKRARARRSATTTRSITTRTRRRSPTPNTTSCASG